MINALLLAEENLKKLLTKLSYYNAAEGQAYYLERLDRQLCKDQVKIAAKTLKELGGDPEAVFTEGQYLASKECLG